MDEVEIREVERDRANAVLALRVFIPGATEGHEQRPFLSRSRPRFEPGRTVAHSIYGSGRADNGRGCWCNLTVFLDGRSADEVAVALAACWAARDGSRGELDGVELVVPWLGAAEAELPGGGWVTADIVHLRPSDPAEPRAAADHNIDSE